MKTREFKFKTVSYSDELISQMKKGCEYEAQAIDFLKETKTNLLIQFSHKGKHFFTDKEKRNIFIVTLENNKHEYTFNFGDSIHNTEKGTTPKAYDVLACLTTYEVEDFADFCMEFGYDLNTAKEIREAQKTHLAVQEESREIKRLFNSSELDLLSEIQ
ncbi:hypothetical protein [uncultured Lutibacter sp.]|uniref:hypothetical protein n=1 Tax=uncultured Lutibacter sp. TaxID=437739 RepID=UPI0026227444|nr:hypothetical protein [uncultured Lutibacter sp.]